MAAASRLLGRSGVARDSLSAAVRISPRNAVSICLASSTYRGNAGGLKRPLDRNTTSCMATSRDDPGSAIPPNYSPNDLRNATVQGGLFMYVLSGRRRAK